MSTVTCLAEKIKVPFKSDIVQFWSTSLVKPLIKLNCKLLFSWLKMHLQCITIVSPNLLTQVQTLAAMGVVPVLIHKFK